MKKSKRIQGATTRNADRLLFGKSETDQRRGTLHPGNPPLPSCRNMDRGGGAKKNPREPSTKTRLPHRQKPHCEAPTGVADPITPRPNEVNDSSNATGEGRLRV